MKTEFSTTDITTAAYLVATQHRLARVEKAGSKGTFIFNDIDPSLITEYDLGHAMCEPTAFHQAIRQLTTAVRRI